VRRLIINADDYGLTPGVNRAIVEAHDHGIVTSATVMANASAFEEAVGQAQSHATGRLSVGCHIVLLDGEPVLPANRVGTLLQPGSHNGSQRFRQNLNNFAIASACHQLSCDEIEAEAAAQMERVQAKGIRVSHFDTHKHAHMFPAVLRPLLRAAQVRKIPAVRNPFGQVWPLPWSSLLRTRQLWKRFAQLNVLRHFAAGFRREVESHGLRTTDGSLGVIATGVLDFKLFTAIVDSIPEGTWEFVCHPGYSDRDLDRVQTRLRQSREQELHLLTSAEAKNLLSSRGIELISYHEL
jgi:predicted glycoside hydrolase/deacetylase ChbG (UPF0249 family)